MTSKEALKFIFNTIVKYKGCATNDEESAALTVIQEELEEKDRLFAKLYVATEDNKLLLKQNRALERKNKMLQDQVADLKHQLVIEKLHKK